MRLEVLVAFNALLACWVATVAVHAYRTVLAVGRGNERGKRAMRMPHNSPITSVPMRYSSNATLRDENSFRCGRDQ